MEIIRYSYETGHERVVQVLIDNVADVNILNAHDSTVLHKAAIEGKLKYIEKIF